MSRRSTNQGKRIRGKENKESAVVALAKETHAWASDDDNTMIANGQWLATRVCSDYIQYCEQGVANGTLS